MRSQFPIVQKPFRITNKVEQYRGRRATAFSVITTPLLMHTGGGITVVLKEGLSWLKA